MAGILTLKTALEMKNKHMKHSEQKENIIDEKGQIIKISTDMGNKITP